MLPGGTPSLLAVDGCCSSDDELWRRGRAAPSQVLRIWGFNSRRGLKTQSGIRFGKPLLERVPAAVSAEPQPVTRIDSRQRQGMHWSSSVLSPSSSYIVYLDAPSRQDALLWLSSPSSSSNSASVLAPIECSTTPVLEPAILPPASASPTAGRVSTQSTEGSSRVGGSYSFEYPSQPSQRALPPLRGSKSTSSALDHLPPRPSPSPRFAGLTSAREDSQESTTAFPLARSPDSRPSKTPLDESAAPHPPPLHSRLPTTQAKQPRLATSTDPRLVKSNATSLRIEPTSTLHWLSLSLSHPHPHASDNPPLSPADNSPRPKGRSSTNLDLLPSPSVSKLSRTSFPPPRERSTPLNRSGNKPEMKEDEMKGDEEKEGEDEEEGQEDADCALMEISREDLPSSSDGEMVNFEKGGNFFEQGKGALGKRSSFSTSSEFFVSKGRLLVSFVF